MRNILLLLLLIGFGNISIYAQEALPIRNVIHSGDLNTVEITYDGEAICVGNDKGNIRRLDPETGELLELLFNEKITTCGLGFDGEYFLSEANTKDKIYYLEKDDLSIVDSIVPPPFNGYIQGIAWDGDLIWYAIFHFGQQDTIYSYDPILKETKRFPFMGNYAKGIAFDGTFLWISDNTDQSNPLIFKIDKNTFEELAVYKAPGGKYPNGLTFDGEYLWASNNETDSIYQLDIGLSTDLTELKSMEEKTFVYPNPCREFVNLSFREDLVGETMEMYNQNGMVVDRRILESQKELLDMSHLTAGQYFIIINSKIEELVLVVD